MYEQVRKEYSRYVAVRHVPTGRIVAQFDAINGVAVKTLHGDIVFELGGHMSWADWWHFKDMMRDLYGIVVFESSIDPALLKS